ncbi:hypothetical protein B296_00002595 [Ensete ventricosum]|uniref:Uncharacterized protein n=1 Tax=Ensete ventricosum TaxID=4639 RepID=A0A427BCD3_ENSVE|nr:hypothetical protein B296_00002595 [Ensete ventricosum]
MCSRSFTGSRVDESWQLRITPFAGFVHVVFLEQPAVEAAQQRRGTRGRAGGSQPRLGAAVPTSSTNASETKSSSASANENNLLVTPGEYKAMLAWHSNLLPFSTIADLGLSSWQVFPSPP